MKLVILGAGTAVPAANRSAASIYLNAGKEHVLLDAGPGAMQRLHKVGVSIFDVDRVFITHYHLDHCLDLATLLFARRIPTPFRQKSLSLYGPRGLRELLCQLNHAFCDWMKPLGFQLALRELGATRLTLPGYTVQTRPMNHYETGAIGYRFSVGKKIIAYSGDTDVCDDVVRLGHKADVLILECSLTDECKMDGHLTPSLCARLAAAAQAKHLVLTHLYPVFEGYNIAARVRRHYRGRLTVAQDFTTLRV